MLSIYRAFPSGPPKANREVSAYNYKHFDAIKALRDNPDLMRSASGDALYVSVRSSILVTYPLLDVKYDFATLSRDESHRNSNVHTSDSTACVIKGNVTGMLVRSNHDSAQKSHMRTHSESGGLYFLDQGYSLNKKGYKLYSLDSKQFLFSRDTKLSNDNERDFSKDDGPSIHDESAESFIPAVVDDSADTLASTIVPNNIHSKRKKRVDKHDSIIVEGST
nr:hypothetical protein [Tanacetum cinerariifolium]